MKQHFSSDRFKNTDLLQSGKTGRKNFQLVLKFILENMTVTFCRFCVHIFTKLE